MAMRLVFAFVALVLGACGSDFDSRTVQQEQICEPGKTEVCACPGAADGAQSCSEDGLAWGECECTSPVPDGGSITYEPEDWCISPPESAAACIDSQRRTFKDCQVPDGGILNGCFEVAVFPGYWCC
jgi:hypothetical protein